MGKMKVAKISKRKAAKRDKMEERKANKPGGKMKMEIGGRLAGETLLGHSMKKMFERGEKAEKEMRTSEFGKFLQAVKAGSRGATATATRRQR